MRGTDLPLRLGSWTVRGQKAALLLFASTLPVLLAAEVGRRAAAGRLEEFAVQTLEARAEGLGRELDAFHAEYGRLSRRLAQFPAARGVASRSATAEQSDELATVTGAALRSDSNLHAITLLDADGRVTFATEPGTIGMDQALRPYFREARSGSPFISDPFVSGGADKSEAFIAYSMPILAEGRTAGVAVLSVRARAFWDAVRSGDGRAGTGSFSVLFDRHGICIAHSVSDRQLFHPGGKVDPKAAAEMLAEGRFGARTAALLRAVVPVPQEFAHATDAELGDRPSFRAYSPTNGAENVIVAMRLKTVPWTLFYSVPESVLLAGSQEVLQRILLVGALVALAALALGLWIARGFTEPLRRLDAAAQKVTDGDLSARVEPLGSVEMRRLGERFNAMVTALAERTREIEQASDELVTHRRALEERSAELAAKNESLIRADRLKSQFLGTMSHDLRTPLNAVIGFTDLMLRDPVDRPSPRQAEQLALVLSAGQHLLTLVNSILELSRMEAGLFDLSVGAVPPDRALGQACDAVRGAALRKHIEITASCSTARLLRADERRLHQVLLHLLSNAIEFSATGAIVDVFAEDAGAFVRISVVDRGAGIEPDLLPRLFEPFVQGMDPACKSRKGIGLGLAISRRIVERHQGFMTVESTPGSGSTFAFTIPADSGSGSLASGASAVA